MWTAAFLTDTFQHECMLSTNVFSHLNPRSQGDGTLTPAHDMVKSILELLFGSQWVNRRTKTPR